MESCRTLRGGKPLSSSLLEVVLGAGKVKVKAWSLSSRELGVSAIEERLEVLTGFMLRVSVLRAARKVGEVLLLKYGQTRQP